MVGNDYSGGEKDNIGKWNGMVVLFDGLWFSLRANDHRRRAWRREKRKLLTWPYKIVLSFLNRLRNFLFEADHAQIHVARVSTFSIDPCKYFVMAAQWCHSVTLTWSESEKFVHLYSFLVIFVCSDICHNRRWCRRKNEKIWMALSWRKDYYYLLKWITWYVFCEKYDNRRLLIWIWPLFRYFGLSI